MTQKDGMGREVGEGFRMGSKLQEIVKDREAWHAAGLQRVGHNLGTKQK